MAAGDLAVELPVGGTGQVGYLTHVFSTVVVRLRERDSQAELERLSVTDALTGLYNRRHLVGTLANEVQRSRRLQRPFSPAEIDARRGLRSAVRRRGVPGDVARDHGGDGGDRGSADPR